MLNLLTHSRVLQYTIYAAAGFAVFGFVMAANIETTFTMIGWLLASMLWYTTKVRTWQIEYMVEQVKKAGATVTSGGKEI
jgi:hypothetical protein